MTKVAFCTDVHLNFLDDVKIKKFCKEICDTGAAAIFLTGDISEAPDIVLHLRLMEMYCGLPIYFICGNHDYYRGSVKGVRKKLSIHFGNQCHINNKSFWLNEHGVITLAPGVAVIGHDGWYDGGYASFFQSQLALNDTRLIKELRYDSHQTFLREHFTSIKKFAQEGAAHVQKHLREAFKNHDTVYLLTHAPPFREASRAPTGKVSDDNWLPYFSSKCMGDAILEVMDSLSSAADLTVLCGHTHTYWECKPRPNVKCITGGAVYGKPAVCKVFEI